MVVMVHNMEFVHSFVTILYIWLSLKFKVCPNSDSPTLWSSSMALLQFDARPFRRILPPPDGAPSHPPPGGQVNGTLVQGKVFWLLD